MRAWVSSFHQHVNSYAFSLEGVSNPRKEKTRGFFTLTVFTQVFFLVVIYYMITRLFKWTHFTDLILNLHHIWFRIEDDSTNLVSRSQLWNQWRFNPLTLFVLDPLFYTSHAARSARGSAVQLDHGLGTGQSDHGILFSGESWLVVTMWH